MSSNIANEDLRSKRTKKALYAAMFSLLKSICFRKITIKGICEEALISRAAFYAHFIDKYDLLKHWIADLWLVKFDNIDNYEEIEKAVNQHINENSLILKNLFYEADNETFSILFDCLLSTINLSTEKNSSEEIYHKNIVLSNFYAGGIISYLLWQIENKFPSEIPLMNRFVYEMIREFQSR